MREHYNLRESWKSEHGGAPIKCILDVSKNIRYFFDLAMAENGLTSIQTRILGHLRHAQKENKDVFQRDIEEVFRIKRSSVTSVLQTLEKKGLISLDYDKPLAGFDEAAYAAYPIRGSMALTERGQKVLELMEYQGITAE